MSTELCPNCGHHFPNAAGPGIYCQECGEPRDPKRQGTSGGPRMSRATRKGMVRQIVHEAAADSVGAAEIKQMVDECWDEFNGPPPSE